MTKISKSTGYPETVQPGIPVLRADPPEGWQRGPLRNHLFEEKRPVKLLDDAVYDLVTVKRGRGGVVKRETKRGADISVKSQFKVKSGDFLISKRQIVHGACGLVPAELDGSTVSNEYAVLRGKKSIDLEFLKYLSHSVYFQQTCFHSSIGVHIEKMIFKTEKWLDWNFDLPPVEEQRKIAEILSTWDRAIETTEKLIENSQAQKKALMQQLLTGKKRLPGFNGEWRRGILSDFLLSIFGGGTPDKSKQEYWGGNIAWASVKDMGGLYLRQTIDSITVEGLKASSSKIVEAGRVITATRMAVGSVIRASIPVAINQDLKAFIPNESLSDDYLFILLRYWAPVIELRGTGSTVKGIRLETLESLPVQIPDPNEQAAISAAILSADSETEKRLANLQALKAEKSALMQQLLTGKRRVQFKEIAA